MVYPGAQEWQPLNLLSFSVFLGYNFLQVSFFILFTDGPVTRCSVCLTLYLVSLYHTPQSGSKLMTKLKRHFHLEWCMCFRLQVKIHWGEFSASCTHNGNCHNESILSRVECIARDIAQQHSAYLARVKSQVLFPAPKQTKQPSGGQPEPDTLTIESARVDFFFFSLEFGEW